MEVRDLRRTETHRSPDVVVNIAHGDVATNALVVAVDVFQRLRAVLLDRRRRELDNLLLPRRDPPVPGPTRYWQPSLKMLLAGRTETYRRPPDVFNFVHCDFARID